MPAYEAAKLANEFDPQNRDENVDYYVAKLDDLVKKFSGLTAGRASCRAGCFGTPGSVVVTQLCDPEIAFYDTIYDAVLRIDSTRPIALEGVLERLGLSNTAPRVAHDFFDKLINPLHHLRILALPDKIFLPCFPRKDEVHESRFNFLRTTFPRWSDSIDFRRRLAFAGERKRCAVS